MCNCQMCNKEIDYEPNTIQLDGTDDIYCLEVCDKCLEVYSDYIEPEQVDEIIKNI